MINVEERGAVECYNALITRKMLLIAEARAKLSNRARLAVAKMGLVFSRLSNPRRFMAVAIVGLRSGQTYATHRQIVSLDETEQLEQYYV